MDTLLDRGSEDLAATRADRYLLILARLRALDAYDRAWGGDERVGEGLSDEMRNESRNESRNEARNEARNESPRRVVAQSER